MNIVFMGNFLYPHGMADTKRIQYALDYLHEHHAATTSVLLLRQSRIGRDEANLSGIYRQTPYQTIGSDIKADSFSLSCLFKYIFDGISFLKKSYYPNKKNILYTYMGPNIENILFVCFAKWYGYTVIFDITEDYLFIGEKPSFASMLKSKSAEYLERHIYLFCHTVLTISNYLKQKFEAIVANKIPVRLHPISININYLPYKQTSFHRPLTLLYAGSFGEKDPVEALIEAVTILNDRGYEVKLRLAGMGLPYRMAAIAKAIAQSPHNTQIEYLGYLPDADYFRLLQECDVPCMIRTDTPYAHAGFPFKLGEYLATGKPTIASRIGDVPLYLQDRINALLVEPGSVNDLVEAIQFVIRHPHLAGDIGKRGREVAEHYFETKVVYANLLNIFRQI
jgi:glycosyltransferase involved in cell wall biosynthesis